MEGPNAFIVTINREPGVGPNYVSPEDLKEAIGVEGSVKDFIKRNLKDMNSVYVLKKELPLLWAAELKEREKSKKN